LDSSLEKLLNEIQKLNLVIDEKLGLLTQLVDTEYDAMFENLVEDTTVRNLQIESLTQINNEFSDFTEEQCDSIKMTLEQSLELDKRLIETFSDQQNSVKKELINLRKKSARVNLYNSNTAK
jgi:hypothetical protein